MIRHGMLATLVVAALVCPVHAQQASTLEEIVVTARKRTETLQEVPLSVSVVSGLEIENLGLQDVTDLYGRVPALYFAKGSITNPTASNNYLIIRGIGWNAGLEPAVGVFIDGMYVPQMGYDLSFLDVERVEVLRGPQGTLFGRNTQGGALNIVTRKPDEEVHGNVRLEYADFDSLRATAGRSATRSLPESVLTMRKLMVTFEMPLLAKTQFRQSASPLEASSGRHQRRTSRSWSSPMPQSSRTTKWSEVCRSDPKRTRRSPIRKRTIKPSMLACI